MPSYQTRNPEAINHPWRSVAMLRPVSVLGADFLRQRDPLAYDRQVAARAVELAGYKLEDAERAYAASRQQLGELNKARSKNRHDRDILPDHQVARMVSQCFGLMNKRRGAILQAKRAVHTAQVALAQLAPVPAKPAPQQPVAPSPVATRPSWFERRIGTLTAQKHAALHEADTVRQHNAVLQAELDQLRAVAA